MNLVERLRRGLILNGKHYDATEEAMEPQLATC
jgi:hypothetical protein